MNEVKGQNPEDTSVAASIKVKRFAPLGIVGTLGKVLFGTFSQEDSKHYK